MRARPATWTVGDPPASPIEASGRQRATPIEPISRTLRHIAGTVSPSGTCTATAIDRLAPMKRRSAPVRWAKRSGRSVTTTTWRGSSSSSAMSAAACPSAAAAVVTTARPPGPCGSQAAQSHAATSSTTISSRQSAGPSHAASWITIARSTPPAPGPVTASVDPSDSSNGTGASVKRAASETTAPTSPVSGPSMADPSTTTSQPIVPVPSDTRRASACSARRAHRRASRHATVRTASTTVGVVATWCCQRAVRCTATAAAKRSSSRARRAPARRSTRTAPTRAATHIPTAATTPTAPSSRNIGDRISTATSTEPTKVQPAAATPTWWGGRSDASLVGTAIAAGSQRGWTLGVRCRVRRQGSAGSVVSAAGPRSSSASDPSAARSTRSRLVPRSIRCPGPTTVGAPIGSPSTRAATRPVSCTNRTPPDSSTSSWPWCGSSAGSARATSTPGARPITC